MPSVDGRETGPRAVKLLAGRPTLDETAAANAAREIFGIDGRVTPLASERDQNFRVSTETGNYVLKVANEHESRGMLEFEHALLDRLAALDYSTAEPIVGKTGETIATLDHEGHAHHVRLLTWVPGVPLATARPSSPALAAQLGDLAGGISDALEGFHHPAAERSFKWDLRRATEIVEQNLHLMDSGQRSLVEATLERYAVHTIPHLASLRVGVIQNDLNDHNVLVTKAIPASTERRISGLIDMGDAISGWVIADLAVAAAYAILDREDVLGVLRTVTSGYQAACPIPENEIAALPGLVSMRLALSAANAAEQTAEEPDNDYLRVSQKGAWRALEQLAAIHPDLATYHLRAACGLEPCPNGAIVRNWLERNAGEFAPLVDGSLTGEDPHVFDLGVGSTSMGVGAPGDFVTEVLSDRLFAQMATAGTSFGIGRYDEVRSWYGGDLFAAPSDEAPRRRTVHVGVDVFAAPGTPLRAPLGGRVVSAAVNEGRLDYGPTIILEHEPEPGIVFWSLYGHLTPESVEAVREGQRVEAGETIAAIGDYPVNGDWPPHLHIQLIADRLDTSTDFAGVCAPEERAIWCSLCPDPGPLLGLDPDHVSAADNVEIAGRRAASIGPSLSISYAKPLTIVRGFRQFLYDVDGQPFLDAVNNVPHVGHCHPHVVAAADSMSSVLNTNTRYLHPQIVEYAERLASKMPDPLEVCYFVCSGSEANELAIRIARTATGRRDIVALDGAYHGNTSTLIDISPYKHNGAGGQGAPEWAHIAMLPDPYRGAHADSTDCASLYADDVQRCCDEAASSGGVAAFIAEPLLGCGGQIVPPPGYLAAAFEHVRAAGGVCIADEVQVGFGRAGSAFWAFETQNVVPDIVTLGKPIGNGFPLAAVVTTRELANAFANGMEYFNTFGGNAVACAVGSAVLDVIEDENLQANAHAVGRQLLAGLTELAQRHEIIGDVRGIGLYLGVELVLDRSTREPAPELADYAANRMRDHGILISTDGPQHNVLKLKPPMCFSGADAERLLDTLDAVLAEDPIRVATPG